LNKLYVSAAWRKYQLEKPDECELDEDETRVRPNKGEA
jgi:hypothetical protein